MSAAKWTSGLAAGLITDISAAVEDSYELNAGPSATDTSMSVVDVAEIETPTFREYSAALSLFRNKAGSTDTPSFDAALALFDGYRIPIILAKRVDKAYSPSIVAGDIISAFGFTNDLGADVPDDGSMLMFDARFKPNGFLATNISAKA